MKLLISSSSNPYYNLATEEYLLKYCSGEYIFLYINQPTVVIGKHQIAPKEVNSKYTIDHGILIARRLSGGGAVFHDEGNLNFSFIRTNSSEENVSYKSITKSIINFLLQMGYEVVMSERNDIMAGGKKISGSAMHIYKNRILAHGTLLINCDIKCLSKSLKGNAHRYSDKSIASKPAKVINLSEYKYDFTATSVLSLLANFQCSNSETTMDNSLIIAGNAIISKLSIEKYSTVEWIYGYSPKYIYSGLINAKTCNIMYKLFVEKGIIEIVECDFENESNSEIIDILKMLVGKKHNIQSIGTYLTNYSGLEITSDILSSLF